MMKFNSIRIISCIIGVLALFICGYINFILVPEANLMKYSKIKEISMYNRLRYNEIKYLNELLLSLENEKSDLIKEIDSCMRTVKYYETMRINSNEKDTNYESLLRLKNFHMEKLKILRRSLAALDRDNRVLLSNERVKSYEDKIRELKR